MVTDIGMYSSVESLFAWKKKKKKFYLTRNVLVFAWQVENKSRNNILALFYNKIIISIFFLVLQTMAMALKQK